MLLFNNFNCEREHFEAWTSMIKTRWTNVRIRKRTFINILCDFIRRRLKFISFEQKKEFFWTLESKIEILDSMLQVERPFLMFLLCFFSSTISLFFSTQFLQENHYFRILMLLMLPIRIAMFLIRLALSMYVDRSHSTMNTEEEKEITLKVFLKSWIAWRSKSFMRKWFSELPLSSSFFTYTNNHSLETWK